MKYRADNYYYDVARRNIRRYRKTKRITQQQLSDMTDLSVDYICEIESTTKNKGFSIVTLGRIADVLDVSISDFFKENR